MLLVDHQIAGGQIRKGAELLAVGGAALFGGGSGPALLPADELALAEHRQTDLRVLHARGQAALDEEDLPGLRQLPAGEHEMGPDAPGGQHLPELLRPQAACAQHQAGIVVFAVVGQVARRRVQIAAVGGQLLGGDAQKLLRGQGLREGRGEEGVEEYTGLPGQALAEVLPGLLEVAQLPGQGAGGQHGVQIEPQLLGSGPLRAAQVAVVAEEHGAPGGDIVRQGAEFRVDQGHVPVRRREAQALLQLLAVGLQGGDEGSVGLSAALLPGDEGPQVGAQSGDALRMELRQGLRHGQDHRRFDIFRAPLAHGVEQAHGVQGIAKELGAHRRIQGRGIDVQYAAAHGELAHALHELGPGVARPDQARFQGVQIVIPAELQLQGAVQQGPGRDRTQAGGVQGGHQEPDLAPAQVVEAAQPLLLPAAGGGGGVVQGQLPCGQHRGRGAQQGLQLPGRAVGGHVVLAQHHRRPLRAGAQGRDHMAAADLRRAGQRGVLAPRLRAHQVPERLQGLQGSQQWIHGFLQFDILRL